MSFDDRAHPRGQAGNAGEFRDRDRGDPEIVLDALEPDYVQEPWVPTYSFPSARLGAARDLIDKANRRLDKYGIAEQFTFDTGLRVVDRPDGRHDEIATITLNRPVISLGGWQFAGSHDFTPDGRVVHHWASPEAASAVLDNHCDFCGLNRSRGKVFTVTDAAGETKQVGSNCLEAFLGVKPQGLWALDSEINLDALEDAAVDGPTAHGGSEVFPAEDLIVASLAASDDGRAYVSKGQASREDPSTGDAVRGAWVELLATGDNPGRRALAREILTWVAAQDADQEGDYIGNLKAVLAGEDRWVAAKHVAIAASSVSAYRNAQEREERDRAAAERRANRVSGFIGEKGEKIDGLEATVTGTRSWEGEWGTTTLVSLRSADGHTVKWFASGGKEYEAGTKVTVKATIKGHDNYDGDDQTIITRAKLVVRD